MSKYQIGDKVILGEHDGTKTSKNWNPYMMQYVGKEATIVRLGMIDSVCQCYRVDIDNGSFEWREINMVAVVSMTSSAVATVSYGCYCTRCTDYNQYIPSDTKNFVCYGCKH